MYAVFRPGCSGSLFSHKPADLSLFVVISTQFSRVLIVAYILVKSFPICNFSFVSISFEFRKFFLYSHIFSRILFHTLYFIFSNPLPGIVLPGQAKEKPQQAEVIAVGPGGVVDGKEVTMQVKAGDKVISLSYSLFHIFKSASGSTQRIKNCRNSP